MVKVNKKEIAALFGQIEKEYGEGSIHTIDSAKSNSIVKKWSTGIEDLDNILGGAEDTGKGGFPYGRIIEISGAEGSGKTTLAYHLMAQHEIAVDIPAEGCVDKETEYFNGMEWVKISDYKKGDKILQYNNDGSATLEKPLKYHKLEATKLWHVEGKRIDMVVSDYHNVVYKTINNNELKTKYFHEIKKAYDRNKNGFSGNIPKTFSYSGNGIDLSENKIRLMVAIFADGSFPNNSTQCYFGVTKERKKSRIEYLLNTNNIRFRVKNGFYIFYAKENAKHYPSSWYGMNNKQLQVVFDEVKHWDGCQFEKQHTSSFSTTNKSDADFIQFVYTSLGYPAYITIRDRRNEKQFINGRELKNKKISYNVCSGLKSKIACLRNVKIEPFKPTDNKMYCFTMKSGMWVMRRNNKIIVTGNTFDAQRSKIFGNKKGQLFVRNIDWAEQALEDVIRFAEKGVPIIVIDSLPFLMTKSEYQEVDFEKQGQQSQLAGLLSRKLSKIEKVLEKNGTTLIIINQLRDNRNAGLFQKQTYTPGGRAIKHAYSVRLEVARVEWINVPNKDIRNSAKNVPCGFMMKVKVTKSKVSVPLGECIIPVFFDRGFVSLDDKDDIRKEVMKNNNDKYKKLNAKITKGENLDDE